MMSAIQYLTIRLKLKTLAKCACSNKSNRKGYKSCQNVILHKQLMTITRFNFWKLEFVIIYDSFRTSPAVLLIFRALHLEILIFI